MRLKSVLPLALWGVAVAPLLVGVALPASDSFHIGEAFAAAVSLVAQPGSLPLTIHGAWDVVPALVSRASSGEANYFYPTIYLSSAMLPAVAALILVLQLMRMLRRNQSASATIMLSVAALSAPALVGIRDLWVLLSSWAIYELLESQTKSELSRRGCWLILSSSIGILWSFDRGLVGLILSLTGLSSAAVVRHSGIYWRIALGVAGGCLLAMLIARLTGTMDYLDNLLFLFKTSAQWRYPISFETSSRSAFALFFVVVSILTTLPWRGRLGGLQSVPFWFASAFGSLVMVLFVVNRPDLARIINAFWLPLLMWAASYGRVARTTQLSLLAVAWAGLFLVVSVVFSAMAPSISSQVLAIAYALLLLSWAPLSASKLNRRALTLTAMAALLMLGWAHIEALGAIRTNLLRGTLITPWQWINGGVPYRKVADAGHAWVAARIRESGSECLFDMTNSGLINAGAALPTCSRFSYPVYATAAYQARLLEELRGKRIRAVVYSTPNWQYQIDGKAMPQRLPLVEAYLNTNFPVQECQHNYCIRRQSPPG